jgi:uncharacterized protein YcbK (DUF882 family)
MKLSANFLLKEFTKSSTATRNNIENIPTENVIKNLTAICEHILEPVRAHFGKPVKINSGFRCYELNRLVGGSKNSQHMTGQAVDMEIEGVPNLELAQWIAANLEFDQLIEEFCKPNDPSAGWCHVSYVSLDKNRKQHIKIG